MTLGGSHTGYRIKSEVGRDGEKRADKIETGTLSNWS